MKEKKDHQLHVRNIPPEDIAAARESAQIMGVTLSAIIREFLKQFANKSWRFSVGVDEGKRFIDIDPMPKKPVKKKPVKKKVAKKKKRSGKSSMKRGRSKK